MFNLKQLTVDLEDAYGLDLRGLFKHAKYSGCMIKGTKKAGGWRRKWYDIGKIIWILHKKCSRKGIIDLTSNLGNNKGACL